MKTKTNYLSVLLLTLLVSSCNSNQSSLDSATSEEISSSFSETISSSDSSSETSVTPSMDFSSLDYVNDLLWLPDLKIEVGQKEYVKCYELEYENSEILVGDSSLLSYQDSYIIGLKEGETFIVYHANDKYQKA